MLATSAVTGPPHTAAAALHIRSVHESSQLGTGDDRGLSQFQSQSGTRHLADLTSHRLFLASTSTANSVLWLAPAGTARGSVSDSEWLRWPAIAVRNPWMEGCSRRLAVSGGLGDLAKGLLRPLKFRMLSGSSGTRSYTTTA